MKLGTLYPTILISLLLLACGDDDSVGPAGPPPPAPLFEVAAVVGSVDNSLTIFEVDDPSAIRTVGLGPEGSPVTIAVSGGLAAVPLGLVPAVAVVDLAEGVLLRTVALAEGSGATGAAFVNDSIVLVGNPGLNTVTPVNVLSGSTLSDIPVGGFPQEIVVVEGRAYVLNAELVNFAPSGPSTITVIDGSSLNVVGTVTLSGENAGSAVLGPDGQLYILNSGSFGAGDGSLSIVDRSTLSEVSHHSGFGEFPGKIAFGGDGNLYVAAFSFGIAVWDPSTESFVRGIEDAVAPAGIPSASGVGADSSGRVYSLEPTCGEPSAAHRLGAGFAVVESVPVGICPIAIGFGAVGG